MLREVDKDQEPSGDWTQHVGAAGKGRQRWETQEDAQTRVA